MINRMEAMTGVDIDGDGDVNDDPPEFTETHKFHVVGGPRAGKSSVIKRIVSHRFDNMPTLNSSFMGVASDGRHLTRLTMPEDVKHAQRGRDILVELQDVVSSLGFKSMLDAPASLAGVGAGCTSCYVHSTAGDTKKLDEGEVRPS